jgi:hypothetical protein
MGRTDLRSGLVLLRLGHLILNLLDFLNGRHIGLEISAECGKKPMSVMLGLSDT